MNLAPGYKPTALITGITGQDGCYLSRLLLDRGYRVVGLLASSRNSSLLGLKYVGALSQIELTNCDLHSFTDTQRVILENEPAEIYHLAAQSSVAASYRTPAATMNANTIPITNLLESVRLVAPQTRIYNASSSEMYGRVQRLPIDETTLFHPVSPYAVSKVAAHQLVSCYRESYGLFAVSGVLFNHESVLRRDNFFTKKLIREARELQAGLREMVTFGNLDVRRDFGYAPKYVEAMWLMLRAENPYDYLICSGVSVSLRNIVEHVFQRLGLSTAFVKVDPSLFRPNDIPDIYGSNQQARERLGWEYDLSPYDVMDCLLQETATSVCNG